MSYLQIEMTEGFEKIAVSFKSVAMEFVQFLKEEAAAKGVQFSSSQLVNLMGVAKEEIVEIYRDILSEARIFHTEILANILESPVVSVISRVYFSVRSEIVRLQHQLSVTLIQAIEGGQEELAIVYEIVMEGKLNVSLLL